MQNKEILAKLESFTEDAIRKIKDSGLRYLLDTKVTDQGLKIGCVLIMYKDKTHHLYDMTKRAYIAKFIDHRKIAISAAINYNQKKPIDNILKLNDDYQSLIFDLNHFKQLKKNAEAVGDVFKSDLYAIRLETVEDRVNLHLNLIQNQFQILGLDK